MTPEEEIALLKKALSYSVQDGLYWTGQGWRDSGCGCCANYNCDIPNELKAVLEEATK